MNGPQGENELRYTVCSPKLPHTGGPYAQPGWAKVFHHHGGDHFRVLPRRLVCAKLQDRNICHESQTVQARDVAHIRSQGRPHVRAQYDLIMYVPLPVPRRKDPDTMVCLRGGESIWEARNVQRPVAAVDWSMSTQSETKRMIGTMHSQYRELAQGGKGFDVDRVE
ncbi:hypothetical protein K466DRAFT_571385 [Polyporus arcularius HHB13444]|uniref:Uncharacterized protein n=1 Tax=Polyporus arcularius HHB13444 TaxID=1314778 RepID=A0A5C3NNL6_9APHY|nr:hypothetical protein K466DRAFT_571385 [Polyporus arcularius HHB13444]